MQRRTAVAAASALSISLLAGVVAVGAHVGALGFAAAQPPPGASVGTVQTANLPPTGQANRTEAERTVRDGAHDPREASHSDERDARARTGEGHEHDDDD